MSNGNDRMHFMLGLFILVGVALVAGGIVLFGSAAYSTDSFIVETVTLESVLGLDVGAPVKFRGVQVGRVRKIELALPRYGDEIFNKNPKLSNAVILELAINPKAIPLQPGETIADRLEKAVRQGLRARIASSSLTGPPLVELVFLTDSKPIELVWKPDYPYIPAGEGTLTQFVDAAGEILESIRKANIGQTITHADGLIVDSQKAIKDLDVPKLRDQAIAFISEARDTNKRIQGILNDPAIDRILHDGADTVTSTKQTVQSPELQKFIADLPTISKRLLSASERLDELLKDPKLTKSIDNISTVTENANAAIADIRRTVRTVNGILGSQQEDLESLISNLRRFSENVATLSEDAKNNPSRLLFGEPPKHVNPGGKP